MVNYLLIHLQFRVPIWTSFPRCKLKQEYHNTECYYGGYDGHGANNTEYTDLGGTWGGKQPIRSCYLGHVTG